MMGEHPSDGQLLLALDREVDAHEAAAVAEHLQACAACRETWDRLAKQSEDIERYCRISPATTAIAPPVVASSAPPSGVRRVTASPALLAAAAAVLLLIAAGWIVIGRSGGQPTPSTAGAVAAHGLDLPLASESPAADIAAVGRAVPSANMPLPSLPSPHAPRRPRASAAGALTAARRPGPTYYWALPYSNGALPVNEGSVVMRVRLTRDQLRLAGIPIPISGSVPVAGQSTDQTNQTVRARVLVGADGMPRAIAFDQD